MTLATLLRADGEHGHDEWQSPDVSLIEEAVRRMDQVDHTETAIEGPDWWVALIGGGSGAFVTSIENRMTGVRFQLVDPSGSQEASVEIVAGGQLGRYPQRLVVGEEDAVRAALHFAETGEPDPSLHWLEEQSD